MKFGIPKEVKDHEYRIAATPTMVEALIIMGHIVLIQQGAGTKIGFSDQDYKNVGAHIVPTPEEVYTADVIIKVKEPQPKEYSLLKKGQVLFCFLHLAPDPMQTEALLKQEVIGISFETVVDNQGGLPLLTPMSEIAGRVGMQAGANALHMAYGGRGVLLGGVPGVAPGKVVVIGGGVAGTEAAKVAIGLGADVTILDTSLTRLRQLDTLFKGALTTLYSTPHVIESELMQADLAVGAVLIPGKQAPKLVSEKVVNKMKPGSVIVDIAIDQGGCFATSRPTTHSDPVYVHNGIVHYCVANIPGACARTATCALVYGIWPYVMKLADLGYKTALLNDVLFMQGLNVFQGKVTNEHVAQDLGYDYHPAEKVLKAS